MGRFQYTGQQWLPELGMYHYRARIYSPTLGRFLQTDPIGFEGGMKLTIDFVRSAAAISQKELTFGLDKGLVTFGPEVENDEILQPVYSDTLSQCAKEYELWRRLFVCRAFHSLKANPRELFFEVSEIFTAFGCPDDMRHIVYFEPAENGKGSEQGLIKDIENYCMHPDAPQ